MDYKYTVLVNTTIGAFMALLDSNIVIVSLPTIIRDLPGTGTVEAIWIVMGYILISATLLLAFGRISDLYGRVKVYRLGFAVFTLGSALCSLAPNGLSLVLFRLVQGTGGALIFSNNAAIITDAFPVTERGKAIGVNQVAGTAGSVSGLTLGGLLTGLFGWRSIFWINIPIGLFATVWAYLRLRELTPPLRAEKIDPIGNLLFASGLSLVLLSLTFGSLSGWSNLFFALVSLGSLLLTVFIFVEMNVKYPMIDLSLFKIRAFSAGVLSNLLASIARGSLNLVLVFYFQGVLGLDALTTGILIVPYSLAFVSLGPLSGYLSDRYGARVLSSLGLLLMAVSFFWLYSFPFDSQYIQMVLPLIVAGAGGGMFVAPNVASIMNSVPVSRRGSASGMSSMLVNTGFLLSLGITFALMASSIPSQILGAVFAGLQSHPNIDVQPFVRSMQRIFELNGFISLIAMLPSLLRSAKGEKSIKIAS